MNHLFEGLININKNYSKNYNATNIVELEKSDKVFCLFKDENGSVIFHKNYSDPIIECTFFNKKYIKRSNIIQVSILESNGVIHTFEVLASITKSSIDEYNSHWPESHQIQFYDGKTYIRKSYKTISYYSTKEEILKKYI